MIGEPPSLWSNPDWYESILAVTIALITLIGWIVNAFILDPQKHANKSTQVSLSEIKEDVKDISVEIKATRIAQEQTNESVKSAHKRIDGLEDRTKRLEDRFLFERG